MLPLPKKPCSLIAEALGAMHIDFCCQIPVRSLVEGMRQQIGQAQGNLA